MFRIRHDFWNHGHAICCAIKFHMATNGFLTTTATTPTPTGSRRNSNSGNPHTAPYGTANKSSRNGNIVVFSGGSAANSLVDVFESLRAANSKDTTLSYVVPISDNGGSSSELIRVFGGPGTFL